MRRIDFGIQRLGTPALLRVARKFLQIDIDGTEKNERFAFGRIRHSDQRDHAVGFAARALTSH